MAINPDSPTYITLGRNIWLHGEYSRNSVPPYKAEFCWTPTYPLFAGACDLVCHVRGIFWMNILMSAILCVCLYTLVSRFLGFPTGWLAALLFTLDPLIWIYNFQAMSDIPFFFFVMLGLFFLLPVLLKPRNTLSRWIAILAGGTSLGLAILTRPTGLYLPIVLLICFLLATFWERRNLKIRVLTALGIFLACYALPSLWMLRNYQTFGIFALSGNENIVMVYYTGGGAWQIQHRINLEEAQERIQKEYDLPPVVVCHNINAFDITPQAVDTQLRKHKWEVLSKYPVALLQSGMIGLPKSLLAHETGCLSYLIQIPVNDNHWERSSLAPFFLWSLFFQISLLLLTIPGIICYFRKGYSPAMLLFLGGYAVYFAFTMTLSGVDCCARYRMPLMLFFYIIAAVAIATPYTKGGYVDRCNPNKHSHPYSHENSQV
ncbi:MAG: glycosyltransferase family 39 protein [Planctomycetia bacterium]|nr:glycosyltransferase family 39 protein [Planctomycetia bacterium]